MCMVILFGCLSINSKAAEEIKPLEYVKFTSGGYTYRAAIPGYFSVFFTRTNSDGEEGICDRDVNQYVEKGKGWESTGTSIDDAYHYLGKKSVYVVWSTKPLENPYAIKIDDIKNDIKNDKDCIVTSISANITKRMPKPQDVKLEEVTVDGKKQYKLSWKSDRYTRCIRTSKSGSYNYYGDYKYMSLTEEETLIGVCTLSNDRGKYANSEPVYIDVATKTIVEGDAYLYPFERPKTKSPSTGEVKPTPTDKSDTPTGKNDTPQASTGSDSATTTKAPAATDKNDNVSAKLKGTKITKISAGKKSATITWKKQTKGGIKGYEIEYSTDKTFKKGVKSVTIKKAKTTSKTIKKLKPGRKYYFRIRTYKKIGAEKVCSDWSKAKKIKIK